MIVALCCVVEDTNKFAQYSNVFATVFVFRHHKIMII